MLTGIGISIFGSRRRSRVNSRRRSSNERSSAHTLQLSSFHCVSLSALLHYVLHKLIHRTVYSMASMSLDNTWMQAQDRAKKAGRILGEVLEKRVQGERPVVLVGPPRSGRRRPPHVQIGSSVGAYTVMEALLYLASLTEKGARGPVPNYVESAYFISLPSAPTPQEWAKCRSVVSRRVVNAWTSSDFVLAGVCR